MLSVLSLNFKHLRISSHAVYNYMVRFENFVKSMPPSLSELKVTPSFCFALKIPDDVTASTVYSMCTENSPKNPSRILIFQEFEQNSDCKRRFNLWNSLFLFSYDFTKGRNHAIIYVRQSLHIGVGKIEG